MSFPEDRARAGGWAGEPQQQLHGRRLSRPVRSQKTEYRVLPHHEVERLQGHYVPVGLGKPSGFYDTSGRALTAGILTESGPIIVSGSCH